MPDDRAPLGEIEVGLTVAQAAAIVQEYDALWRSASGSGKRKMRVLPVLRDHLAREVAGG